MALGQAAAFSRDVRRRDIYDWFQPDDSTILDTLEALHPYNFGNIATDVIGYTYQRFLEATERHQIGHYLTPPAVVDHILDAAQYTAANRNILGRKLLDPACGSGSFLVHAAARYKEAIADAYPGDRVTAAEEFLRAVQELFLGIDINPFSCYLARINLLVQALDDIAFLRSQSRVPPVTELQIFNGDSLDFRGIVSGQEVLPVEHGDPVLRLKAREAGRLMYVVGNPPYINIKQENLQLNDLRALPFFAEWLHGDANTYLLFLRVGLHFLAAGGVLAFIVPGTVLGDQQAETFRRNIIRQGFSVRHVTRFYTERVLFKPVEQATCVLTITRDAGGHDVLIRGGGTAATSQEAVEDVLARPEIQLPEASIWIWVNPAVPPVLAAASPPQSANNWSLAWSVIPERVDYYDILRKIVSTSRGTVSTLFRDLGLDFDSAFRQGDVNTTHISPFHVPPNTEHAMPLYKGEEVDQLIPFVYEPGSGPKGRTPYLRPDESKAVNANHHAALERLKRIATLTEPEYGFVLHEIGGLRVKRAIAGSWFERGNGTCMVFPHTLWVVRGFYATDGKALLGLLTSLVMNFLYHAISTNDHVSRTLLATFPVPDGFRNIRDRLASLVDASLEAGSQLIVTLARYGVNRGRAMRTGEPVLDPIAVLSGSSIVTTDIRTWRARGLIIVSDAPSLERFTVATAFRRGALAPAASVSQAQRSALGLWVDTYGKRRWAEFERLDLPDNADAFVARWESAQREIATRIRARHETQAVIDQCVADWYQLSPEHRALVDIGVPWLVAGEQAVSTEEDGDSMPPA